MNNNNILNHKKSSNNDNTRTNNSTNNENQIYFEEVEVKIDIENENDMKATEHKDTQINDNSDKNNVFVLEYPGPDEPMTETGQQFIYRGGNLNQQPPPYPTQQQSQYPPQQQSPYSTQPLSPYPEQQQSPYLGQQQSPPAEQPSRETEATYVIRVMYTPESRNRFIKRIMSIVFIMLVMTAAFIAIVLAVPDVKDFFDNNRTIIIFPTIILIVVVNYTMTCLSPCTRYPPCNIIFLLLSVVGMSLLSGVVTSFYNTQIVLYAFMTTTAVVFMCIILACTAFDFTNYMLYVIVLVTTLSVLAAVILTALLIAQVELKPAFLAFLIIATLLQVIIFTIHLQTIIGGKRIVLREEEYALGAYMLYMSIIDIFVKMVFMFGISSEM